jgi:uroporphyrinogen decarboxylase
MTSRERVLLALQHKEPDKVPIDFGGMRSTGIMAIAYANLKKYLGLNEGETRVYDIGQQLADIEKYFLDLFEVDVIDMMNSFVGIEPGEWKEWILKDGSRSSILKNNYPEKIGNEWYLRDSKGRLFSRMPENSLYFDSINPQLETISSKKDIDDFDWYYFTDEELKLWEKKSKYLFENTNYAIMAGFGGNMMEGPQELRGWMNFMGDLAGDENYVDDLLDKFVEVYLQNLKMFLQATGKYVQLIQMGDDLGTQRGPLLSPDLYREKIKPRHKKMFNYIRQNSDVCVFLHSCGSIYKLIPDLIDAGVQALNPIQTNAAEMDPKTLKKEFGDKLTFWGGGCETQLILMNGSPEQVEQQVKERMEIFSPGGGYVFCQVHNIQYGIAPENIMAMFNAAKKYRNYSK